MGEPRWPHEQESQPAQDGMPDDAGNEFLPGGQEPPVLCESVMGAETYERARQHLVDMGEVAGGELDELGPGGQEPPRPGAPRPGRAARGRSRLSPVLPRMEEIAFGRSACALSHKDGVLGWPARVPQTVKYALSYLFAQSEFGLLCPVNMTDSTARMLKHYASDELKAAWIPRLTTTDFPQLLQGTQWMTEKTGGSDVGAATTTARRDADGTWRLWGDKWFAPRERGCRADLARPKARPRTRGLGMFLVPKYLATAPRTAGHQRLKDKLARARWPPAR